MKVPFRLRRRAVSEPAVAVLLPSHEPRDLLRLWERLELDPLPPAYVTAEGFLVKLPKSRPPSLPGLIRLRALADDLYLPADAELVPELLADEAKALVRERGLIFLPGGKVLEFASKSPMLLEDLIAMPVRRSEWRPLPERPALADGLHQILLDLPEPPPDVIIESGAADMASEDPRPPSANPAKQVLGSIGMGLGKGIAKLGQLMHWGGLARAGAKLAAGAINMVPRLSEKVLGQQEAALRYLLHLFREGKVDQALRRALPLNSELGRGSTIAGDASLPTNSIWYSLASLFGGGTQGPASLWLGGGTVYQDLFREYRKQAEEATRRGDYRRAAFIYAKLLNDYRSAAGVLSQGGLHHDAAIIYLKKIGDVSAAAREFEAAGEIDKALELYRQRGDHEAAGDLLRRAGDEEGAVAEYVQAADLLVETGKGHYRAGELILHRAKRADLALPYYEVGWARRPRENTVPCGIRLLQLHLQFETYDRFDTVVEEAGEHLRGPGNELPAEEFYRELVRLAEMAALTSRRDDLRDQARTILAGKLRARVKANTAALPLVTSMFGQSPAWSPALVSDAQFAVKRETRLEGERRNVNQYIVSAVRAKAVPEGIYLPARLPIVTAVCSASASGDVFVGFASGEVHCFRPGNGEIVTLPLRDVAVESLTASADGSCVAALISNEPGYHTLAFFSRRQDGSYQQESVQPADSEAIPKLSCEIALLPYEYFAIRLGGVLQFRFGRLANVVETIECEERREPDVIILDYQSQSDLRIVLICGNSMEVLGDTRGDVVRWQSLLPAAPVSPMESMARYSPRWIRSQPNTIELAAISSDQQVCWSGLVLEREAFVKSWCVLSNLPGKVIATTMVKPGQIVAVTEDDVVMLRSTKNQLAITGTIPSGYQEAVACYPFLPGHELIVVSGDGTLHRVALPK